MYVFITYVYFSMQKCNRVHSRLRQENWNVIMLSSVVGKNGHCRHSPSVAKTYVVTCSHCHIPGVGKWKDTESQCTNRPELTEPMCTLQNCILYWGTQRSFPRATANLAESHNWLIGSVLPTPVYSLKIHYALHFHHGTHVCSNTGFMASWSSMKVYL